MKIYYTYIFLYALFFLFFYVFVISFYRNQRETFENIVYNPTTQSISDEVDTSHTVNLPINTTYSCSNVCGPQSQCSKTREQCTSDIDCYGCAPLLKKIMTKQNVDIIGQNDAGKLTMNQAPRFSSLTTDIGTRSALYGDKLGKVPRMYEGVNIWRPSFDAGMQLEDDKYTYLYSAEPKQYTYLPSYPKRETTTGLFEDNGPLAANAYL